MKSHVKTRHEARTKIIKAMAHPSRLFIIEELSKRECCVNELTAMIGADTSTVSKHLSVLKNAGLVADEKKLEQILARLGVSRVDYAYGDTWMDIPLLEHAEHPVAVYPDKKLKVVALERGWEIIGSFRHCEEERSDDEAISPRIRDCFGRENAALAMTESYPVFLKPAAMPLMVSAMISRRGLASAPSGSGRERRRRRVSTWM